MEKKMSRSLITLKYGAETVTDDHGVNVENLEAYTAGHASLLAEFPRDNGTEGLDIVTVTSGAVALGKCIWRQHHDEEYPDNPQPLALLGSAGLVVAWQAAYAKQDILAGQILTTQHEIEEDLSEADILQRAINLSRKLGIIPVVNENDALSLRELNKLAEGADNDRLARFIAQLMRADILCLLTNVDGIENTGGAIVREVPYTIEAHQEILALVRPEKSTKGRNGMETKIREACLAARLGIETYIANANANIKDVIANLAGTHLVARAFEM